MRFSGAEKTIVEPSVLYWCLQNNFDMTVVDTSAVFNPYAGRYLRRQASESLPDLCGNRGSLSVWIELKAPKKRRAILQSPHQIAFLERKIKQGCFAAVVDSAEYLDDLWKRYLATPESERKQLLLNEIPRPKVVSSQPRSNRSK